MSIVPSIKGTVFAVVVGDVNELLADGRTSRAEVAQRLSAEDVVLLGQTINAASWYDIRAWQHGDSEDLWSWERVAADRIVFRLLRSA
jgi:hypothetical protein